MKGILGLILALIAPLPPVVASSVQPTEMITIAPGEFIMGSSEKDLLTPPRGNSTGFASAMDCVDYCKKSRDRDEVQGRLGEIRRIYF